MYQSSIRKHGVDAFIYEVLKEDNDPSNLNDRENFYIEKFNTIWPEGYNHAWLTH